MTIFNKIHKLYLKNIMSLSIDYFNFATIYKNSISVDTMTSWSNYVSGITCCIKI